jgi:hypothetical protein
MAVKPPLPMPQVKPGTEKFAVTNCAAFIAIETELELPDVAPLQELNV